MYSLSAATPILIRPQRYSVQWLILILFAILVILFFPYLFNGKTFLPSDMLDTMTGPFNTEYGPPQAQNQFPFDGLAQTFPYKLETKEALEKGKLAYWNPHILAGYPEYAETMANNFDPLNILLLWFEPADAMLFETLLELFIAGIGMLLLLRFFGVTPIANLLFAAAYMLNSCFITNSMHRWAVASFCWMPFIVLMVLGFFHEKRKQDILFASLFLALSFLGGNMQTAFFVVFVISIVVLCYPSEDHRLRVADRLGILIILGATGLLG